MMFLLPPFFSKIIDCLLAKIEDTTSTTKKTTTTAKKKKT
jgi:hypothetical protein